MKRKVLIIPIEEIQEHFKKNSRQDIKIIAPSILTEELYNLLIKKGKILKREVDLDGIRWQHSEENQPNKIAESEEFIDYSLPQYVKGPIAISFANEKAIQDKHYHRHHIEIYFSEHLMNAEYRHLNDPEFSKIELKKGGTIIFAPEVIHKMELNGLTIIIEVPSVENDRYIEEVKNK